MGDTSIPAHPLQDENTDHSWSPFTSILHSCKHTCSHGGPRYMAPTSSKHTSFATSPLSPLERSSRLCQDCPRGNSSTGTATHFTTSIHSIVLLAGICVM